MHTGSGYAILIRRDWETEWLILLRMARTYETTRPAGTTPDSYGDESLEEYG